MKIDHLTTSVSNQYNQFSGYKAQRNHVLMIEDNLGDARLIEILLGESDLLECDIKHCISLKAGVEELKKGTTDYAAVLLDMNFCLLYTSPSPRDS